MGHNHSVPFFLLGGLLLLLLLLLPLLRLLRLPLPRLVGREHRLSHGGGLSAFGGRAEGARRQPALVLPLRVLPIHLRAKVLPTPRPRRRRRC